MSSNKWCLIKENQRGKKRADGTRSVSERWIITRWNSETKRPDRLPVSEYRHIRENEAELEALVKRLNAPLSTRAKVEFKHAFINDALLADYLTFRLTEVHNQSVARTKCYYLKTYILDFFVGKLDVMDPANWYQYRNEWADFLLKSKTAKSARTKKDIIYEANKFLDWLAEERRLPTLYRHVNPLSKGQLRSVDRGREAAGQKKRRRPVTDKDWQVIKKRLPEAIMAQAFLGYYYGLRRSETLGVKVGDAQDLCLRVERQLVDWGKYDLPKGGKPRSVPHWFSKKNALESWVEAVQEHRMTPWMLTKRWREFMNTLGLRYDFHDLRHTFINKAMDKTKRPKLVQRAAGHASLVTTDGYTHDIEELDDDSKAA